MPAVLSDMQIHEISLVGQGADPDAHVVLVKSLDVVTPEEKAPMADLNPDLAEILKDVEGADALSDDIVAALNSFAERPAETPVVAEVTKETEEPVVVEPEVVVVETPAEVVVTEEPVAKSAEMVSMQKRLEDMETELAKARANEEIRVLVAKVKTEVPAVVVDAENLASIMYRIGKGVSDQADADAVLEVLKSASTAVREAGTFNEVGSSRTEADDSSPLGKILADIQRENPELSKQQAVAKAMSTPAGMRAYEEAATAAR